MWESSRRCLPPSPYGATGIMQLRSGCQKSSRNKYLHQFTIKHWDKWWKNKKGIEYVSGLRHTGENTGTWVSAEPESHVRPAQLEEKCWCEHFSFPCFWFPWPRETVLKQTHSIPLITVVSALGRKEMKYSVLWSWSEGFGALWRKLGTKEEGREALSDPQMCIVSQNLSWYLWQVGGN